MFVQNGVARREKRRGEGGSGSKGLKYKGLRQSVIIVTKCFYNSRSNNIVFITKLTDIPQYVTLKLYSTVIRIL